MPDLLGVPYEVETIWASKPSAAGLTPIASANGVHSDFEPGDHPGVLRTYQWLREGCPVACSASLGGYWGLLRYAGVATAARDPQTFASGSPVDEVRDALADTIAPALNPPEHTHWHKLMR